MIPSVFLDKQQLISQELKFDIYYNRISELNLNDILGLTSEIKKIQIKIGPFVLKRKLRALSEIAAHAFVKEFYDIW